MANAARSSSLGVPDVPGLDLSWYTLEPLQRDERFILYRARTIAGDGAAPSLLVRSPASPGPTLETLEQMQREHAIRAELRREWAAVPLALTSYEGRPVLACEDPGGIPLSKWLLQQTQSFARDLEAFLRIAIGIASAMREMHARGLVHKDIKPANILVGPEDGVARLTGFGIASRRPRERAPEEPPQVIAATLAYMSPEQTGLLNRSIDPRSDLYSLGVTLYETLTGSLPFRANQPMEWLHSHVARLPTPPSERVPGVEGIGGAVSGIVIKLLAKSPENRYQTAGGLQRDLEQCLGQWVARRRIDEFPLGAHDVPDRLTLAEKLYGREQEVEALVSALGRAADSGATELVLVSGPGGIGKSALVRQLESAVTARGAVFAMGKPDQSKRHVPYAPLAQAFRSLVRGLLARPEPVLAGFREKLREALGSNGRVVADLVPELAVIVGEPAPLVPLSPMDEKQRTHLVLRRFVAVFAEAESPLVLFLDDLQWADGASFDALVDLVTSGEVRHLVVIGAYRDNELEEAPLLDRKLGTIRQGGARVREVHLGPLRPDDLTRWIAESLRDEENHVAELARLVGERSAGNPFLAMHYLWSLAEDGLLHFDHREGRWRWDAASVFAEGRAEDVVQLLLERFSRLPPETRLTLRQMACVGNGAARSVLSLVLDRSPDEVDVVLAPALALDLVERQGDSYRFAHDRVQEAAYTLGAEPERREAHLHIGRVLDANTPAKDREMAIFDIVSQLNRGAMLISDSAERERLAEKNLLAAERAKSATAYTSALEYVSAGRALLPDDAWERRHELAFALELLSAHCEALTGSRTEAIERLIRLSTRVASAVERAAVACLRNDIHFALEEPVKAIEVCLDYLRQVGVDLPRHPTKEQVRREYEATWSLIRTRPIEDLVELPLMTDPASLATMNVLATIGQAMFFAAPDLYVLAECLAVRLSLEHGNTDGSCDAYLRLGLITAERFGEYGAGYRLGKVGYDLVEKKGLKRYLASTYTGFTAGLMPLGAPARVVRDLVPRVYDLVANDFADRLQAIWYGPQILDKLLAAGDQLAVVESRGQDALRALPNEPASVGSAVIILTAQLAFVRNLRGLTDAFGRFDGPEFDEGRFEAQFADKPALGFAGGWYWVLKVMARFFAGDYAAALRASTQAGELHRTAETMLFYAADHHLFGALARAACFDSATDDERRQHAVAMAEHHRQLRAWAESCPENYEYRAALVAAEIARVEGREVAAQRLYEQSIRAARAGDFVHGEALAHEVAARYYASRGFETFARTYLSNARDGYRLWGAEGKVRELDRELEQLSPTKASVALLPSAGSTFVAPLEQLDLATMVNLAQLVSIEIVPEALADTLMRTALEHAGADRGVLLLPGRDGLRVRAFATTGAGGVQVAVYDATAEGGPPAGDLVPESIVSYVARTRERVVIGDLGEAGSAFADDPYSRREQPKSQLCLPLIQQGTLVGVLYLENRLMPRTFTPTRLTALTVLAASAAISLEHSRLYRELENRQRKIRALFESNLIGVMISEPSWGHRLVDANDAFLRITGYTREDLAAGLLTGPSLTPPEWAAATDEAIARLRATGYALVEKECFRKDGSRVPILVGTTLIPGEPSAVLGFVLDLTDRKRAEEERERARRLQMEQESAVANERTRLAAEIHDSLAQQLATLIMQLGEVEANLRSAPSLAEKPLALAHELAVESLSYARRSVSMLRPGIVAGGLPRALRDIVESARRHFDSGIELSVSGTAFLIDAVVESALVSIAREALTNAVRHSQGKRVDIQLTFSGSVSVQLVVSDDGVGFDEERVRTDGFGLVSMRERATRAGIALTFVSEPGAGTEVIASWSSPESDGLPDLGA